MPRTDRAARRGKLDPVIGRDEEIRRVVQVLPAAPRTTRADRRARRGQDCDVEAWPRIISGDVPEGPEEQALRRP